MRHYHNTGDSENGLPTQCRPSRSAPWPAWSTARPTSRSTLGGPPGPTPGAPLGPGPRPKSSRPAWLLPTIIGVCAFFLGSCVGAVAGTASDGDSTTTAAGPRPTVTITAGADQQAELDQRESELDQRHAELDIREAQISNAEAEAKRTQIGPGIWTVGRDVEPGTYRTTEELVVSTPGECYWSILVTGTNGADIVKNDLPDGGFPQVTLEEGHDFESHGCGTWSKQ
jgi:hypothetical protein